MKLVSTVAPAKINLFLKVAGRRPDGYHELHTLFMPLAVPSDTVSMHSADGLMVSCSNSMVPDDERNICHRAATAYAAKSNIPANWRVDIEKRIPVAAGMGGGSSDAAAVLKLLNSEYGRLAPAELAEIALSLGADVPFFLDPRPAIATGVGEILTFPAISFPAVPLLIINPGFPVSAAWAYRNLAPDRTGGDLDAVLSALADGALEKLGKLLHNDLAPALYHKFPLLEIIRNFLLKNGAPGVEITGSGPTLFAICHDFDQKRKLAAQLQHSFPFLTILETELATTRHGRKNDS